MKKTEGPVTTLTFLDTELDTVTAVSTLEGKWQRLQELIFACLAKKKSYTEGGSSFVRTPLTKWWRPVEPFLLLQDIRNDWWSFF